MSDVKIAVDHIKDVPLTLHFEEPVERFPLLADMQGDNSCSISGLIRGDISAVREFETIRVTGRVSAPLALTCSRCLTDYPSFIDTGFTIFFRRDTLEAHHSDELELSDADLLSSTYTGDEIELTGEIAEQVAMEIPLKPLCSENCKGLCHECGTDLNTSHCSCRKEAVSMAFSALKNFKVTQ